MADLHTRLLAAHTADDKRALVTLYEAAADATNDTDAACFFLTHAWVYALETDDPASQHLYDRLADAGRV